MTINNPPRKGDWMQLNSGRRYWPLDPRPDDFCIEDIAHGLSYTCRWGGQVEKFYSVAQHSVLVATMVRPELQLEALLHDASEAYLGDLPRPLKRILESSTSSPNPSLRKFSYAQLESNTQRVISEVFGIHHEIHPDIKAIDNRITVDERIALFNHLHVGSKEDDWMFNESQRLGLEINPWSPEIAKLTFMRCYNALAPRDGSFLTSENQDA